MISNSILGRALQQQIAKEGFHVSQLDASFDHQSVFSSRNGAFFVQIAESTQVSRCRVNALERIAASASPDAQHSVMQFLRSNFQQAHQLLPKTVGQFIDPLCSAF